MDDCHRLRQTIEAAVGIPFSEGNEIVRYRNGDEIFPAMLDAIRTAERSVELLTFVYWTGTAADRFAAALADAARRGVTVRLLLDWYGAQPMKNELADDMAAAGVAVRWFRPATEWRVWEMDNRTHRKVLVVDGSVAFTGGVGIAAEWEGDARNPGEWRETHFRVRGPAVQALRGAFWGNWMEVEHTIEEAVRDATPVASAGTVPIQVVRSTASIGWSDVAMVIDALITMAERRLRIVTAYFAPDDETVAKLIRAAERGVDVEILIPGPHIDKRVSELAASDAFLPLLEAGVTIWRFQPTMIHTKVILMDESVVCIGSPNLNMRSMRKDDEIALVAVDRALAAQLDRDFDDDVARSEKMTADGWEDRGLLRRAAEAVAGPVKRQT